MNSTPPIAFFRISFVFGAVWPIYWPTRSSRVTETRWPLPHIAEAVQDLAMRSATVVLPVPGLPVKLMCRVGVSRGQAESRRDAIDQQQRRDLADALLDRREADELAVELVEHLPTPDSANSSRRSMRSSARAGKGGGLSRVGLRGRLASPCGEGSALATPSVARVRGREEEGCRPGFVASPHSLLEARHSAASPRGGER